jgi:tetratricopeptide (TPR) repeat protein
MKSLSQIYDLREKQKKPGLALIEAEMRLEKLAQNDFEMWGHLMLICGNCLLDLNRCEEAEKYFSKTWERIKDPIALANRGLCQWRLGKNSAAYEDYKLAVNLQLVQRIDARIPIKMCVRLALLNENPLDAIRCRNFYLSKYGKDANCDIIDEYIKNYLSA